MRSLFVVLALISSGCALAAQQPGILPTVKWQAPTHQTDGTEITSQSQRTYTIHLVKADQDGKVSSQIRELETVVDDTTPFKQALSKKLTHPVPAGSKLAVTVTIDSLTSDYSKARAYNQ